MRKTILFVLLGVAVQLSLRAADKPDGASIDQILQSYIQAVGGQAAVDRIQTREVRAGKLTYFWQKPNKVLLITKKEKIVYDGSGGWVLSKKKHLTRLAKHAEQPLEIDANPIRYVHLKTLYFQVNPAPAEEVDGVRMDVLVAPNDIGATKFYFDHSTHLLARIVETGETSAYYKQTIEFLNYKEVDGVRLPFRIIHSTTEPGVSTGDLRISQVRQNIDLKPEIFSKPTEGTVTFGGKR